METMLPTSYEMMAKHSNVEKLFEEFFFMSKKYDVTPSNPWQPPTDVYETDNDIIVKIAVSGLNLENISVVFSDYVLTVSGKRDDSSLHQKVCFYQVEIRYGYFERKIRIPKNVDANNIKATYNINTGLITLVCFNNILSNFKTLNAGLQKKTVEII